jgi:hypothetical protein
MGIREQAQTRSVSLSRMQPFRIWMSLGEKERQQKRPKQR